MSIKQTIFLITIVGIGIVSRILPHASNFVPVLALTLLSAAYLPRKLALLVPLSIMVTTDLVIGLHPLILYTWGSLLLISLMGSYVRRRRESVAAVVWLAPAGSVLFYLITNFGVWMEGRMYAHSFSGLIQCYEMGLPFFRNSLLADCIYTPLLFGLVFLARRALIYRAERALA